MILPGIPQIKAHSESMNIILPRNLQLKNMARVRK